MPKRKQTFFPYLAVARETGESYADVLWLADEFDKNAACCVISQSSPWWAHAVLEVWGAEQDRREKVIKDAGTPDAR